MTPKRAERLKITCDTCSASKIKCEKQRPQCSRCNKLGYQCFYSPARRKGRPHLGNNRDPPSVDSVDTGERPPKKPRTVAGLDHTSLQTEVRDIVGPSRITRARSIVEQQQQQHEDFGNYDYEPDGILNYQQGTSAYPDHQSNMPFHSNVESSTSTTGTSSPNIFPLPIEPSNSLRLDLADDTSTNVWSAKSSNSDPGSGTEYFNCALLAMEMLQQLKMTCMQPLPQIPSSNLYFHIPTLDARIHANSTAIRRLSTILICPCSCNPDVGLLNVALCAAILDSYWTILRSSVATVPQTSAEVDNPIAGSSNTTYELNNTINLTKDLISHPENMQLGVEYQGSGRVSQQVIVRRVLEELPKVAHVVMQFTRRYSDTSEAAGFKDSKGDVALLLPTLAVGQKIRLKDMIEKATNLLANVQ